MSRQKSRKQKNNHLEKTPQTQNGSPTILGVKGVFGVSLIAGALFNIPEIWKIPKTDADWMMLIIVLTMALGGAILLFFRFKKQ